MSTHEDHLMYRETLGDKKYFAMDEYIVEFGKIKEWREGLKKLRDIEDLKEYDKEYLKLSKKCKPIFIEDILYDSEEYKKFEKWYKEKLQNEEEQIDDTEEM